MFASLLKDRIEAELPNRTAFSRPLAFAMLTHADYVHVEKQQAPVSLANVSGLDKVASFCN